MEHLAYVNGEVKRCIFGILILKIGLLWRFINEAMTKGENLVIAFSKCGVDKEHYDIIARIEKLIGKM